MMGWIAILGHKMGSFTFNSGESYRINRVL